MAKRHLYEMISIAALPVLLVVGFVVVALVYAVTWLVRR
jgi:hypothetical protein